MSLPVEEIVRDLGMQLFFAPLDDNIFGKTYFETSTVTVYSDTAFLKTEEKTIAPGTMLVNPNTFFMYNIGTINNTIIHECVHLERYKMFFELMRLLSHECHFLYLAKSLKYTVRIKQNPHLLIGLNGRQIPLLQKF